MTATPPADWRPMATSLGLEPLGPVPSELPDAWLLRLEQMAGWLGAAAEDASYRGVLGEDGVPEGVFRAIARAWLFTDDLEGALQARLAHEAGPRRRWLELLHRRGVRARIEGDAEVARLTASLERATWRFLATAPPELPATDQDRLRALALRTVPLAQANRATMVSLFKRRNELARAEGHASYFELAMDLHEAPWTWLEPHLVRLKAATDGPACRALAWLATREGRPITTHWELRAAERAHTLIPAERLVAPDLAVLRALDAALGLPALGLPHSLVIRPFGVGGLCSVVDGHTDVRIALDATRPRHTQLGILLHEYGHALHQAVGARTGQPYHLWAATHGEPVPACEAMATILEAVKLEPAWLATVTDGTPAEVAAWAEAGRLVELLAVRYHLMVAAFDREAYRDPDQDLDAAFARVQRDHLGLQPTPEAACLWAANPMAISSPCYQIGYVLANMAAYQLREALGGALWGNPGVGPFLAAHFWKPAASVPWLERIKQATGRSLDAEAVLRALVATP
ncbi:MAG: hypothetical protein VKS61_13060 [Candidatus Sericytochromatia bacterium]|nr:hypothetical protein [Candidatus Sericytochromatia bacterium]